MPRILIRLIAVLAFAAPQVLLAQDSAVEAIRAVREQSNVAIAERDLAALQATWVDDFNVSASNGDVFSGGQAMADAFASSFEDPEFVTYRRTPTIVSISEGGGFGAESGEWVGRWNKPDGEMRVSGVYLAQWQNRGGEWRLRSELFVALSCSGSASCDLQ